MAERIVPMIHVADVRGTVDWYKSIGFELRGQNVEDGDLNWASLMLGDGEVMFDSRGKPSAAQRREVDLYIWTGNVDDLAQRIRHRVQVVEDLHETIYGMREFIIRDINGFWITFGEPVRK
jgi:hypothetical protein